jgi:hypothetical protein
MVVNTFEKLDFGNKIVSCDVQIFSMEENL